jgi:thiosulfate reductase cytochrome b subunit
MNGGCQYGAVDPRTVCWLQIHDWGGRYLGMFTSVHQVEAWIQGRGGRFYLLNSYQGGRIARRLVVSWTADRGMRFFSFAAAKRKGE